MSLLKFDTLFDSDPEKLQGHLDTEFSSDNVFYVDECNAVNSIVLTCFYDFFLFAH